MYASTTAGHGTRLRCETRPSKPLTLSRFAIRFPTAPGRRLGSATLAKASSNDPWPAPSSYKLWPTDMSISSGLYNAIQGAELVFYAALVDAGFSGDWSRIGVLTTDQELLAQQAWWFILVAHSTVAVITLQYATKRGFPPLEAGVRGLLFGTLGLYDVYLRCQDKDD